MGKRKKRSGNKQFDIMIMQKTDYDFKNGLLIQNKVDVSKYEFDNVGFDENKQPYFTVKEIKGGSNASTE